MTSALPPAAPSVDLPSAGLGTSVSIPSPGNFRAPLSQYRYVKITGADAETFLQGQFSNDVRQVSPTHGQLTSHHSAKGRVLFVASIFRWDDAYILELSDAIFDAAVKRLRMFVLRSKVAIEVMSEEFSGFGVAGNAATQPLQAAGLALPEQDWDMVRDGNLLIIRRPGLLARYTLHGPISTLDALAHRFESTLPLRGASDWRRLDLLSGLPTITAATQDHFVAQMLNLDTLGAIGFSKGCYTGQEVIARMHYLGNLKRRMMLASCAAQALPADPVYAIAGDGQAVGEVVDSIALNEHTWLVQLVLQLSQIEAGLALRAPDGARLTLHAAAPT
jgi:folate-binding protein YgfZ